MIKTTVEGSQTKIALTPGLHFFELMTWESPNHQVVMHLTWEQAQQIHDEIEKTKERMKAAKADGVPINPAIQMPSD